MNCKAFKQVNDFLVKRTVKKNELYKWIQKVSSSNSGPMCTIQMYKNINHSITVHPKILSIQNSYWLKNHAAGVKKRWF